MNEVISSQGLNLTEDGIGNDERSIEICKQVYAVAYRDISKQLSDKNVTFTLEGSYARGNARFGLLPANSDWIEVANLQVMSRRAHENNQQPSTPSDIDIAIHTKKTRELVD